MKKHFFIFVAAAVIISSCGKPAAVIPTFITPLPTITPTIQPTVTPVCISSKPTQRDINRALAYTGGIFGKPDWEQSYTVNESAVDVLWQNVSQSALVYLEALIKPCGYEEPDLNKDFSDENWKDVFSNYESYKLMDECKTNDGLRLYEFKTHNQGFDYEVRYWVENDTDTRVIVTMIVFPIELKLLLDEYSSQLFPDYSTCP